MKIRTTLRFPFTPERMVIMKKPTNNSDREAKGKRNTLLLVGVQTGEATVKISVELPPKKYDEHFFATGICFLYDTNYIF